MGADIAAITQNEHFRGIAAILHIPVTQPFWGTQYPTIPFHTRYNALVKVVDPERPYQESDVLAAFVALQVAIAEADASLVMPLESIEWLTERILSKDGLLVMSMLLAYAGLRWDYATPAEVAAATGTDDSWWRRQAIDGLIPGARKSGKQWLLPVSVLKARGVDVSTLEKHLEEEESATMYATITDAYAAFEELFGSEPCPWTRDQFQVWLHGHGHRRYEDIDQEVMDAAYAACIAQITGE